MMKAAAVMYLEDLAFYDKAENEFHLHALMKDTHLLNFLDETKNIIILINQLSTNAEQEIYKKIFQKIREHLAHLEGVTLYATSDLTQGISEIEQDNQISHTLIRPETFTSKTLFTHLIENTTLNSEQLSKHSITHFQILSSHIMDEDFERAKTMLSAITQAFTNQQNKAPSPVSKKRKLSPCELAPIELANPYQGNTTLFSATNKRKTGPKTAWVVFDTDETLLAFDPSNFFRRTELNLPVIHRAHEFIKELQDQGFEVKCSLMSARSIQNEKMIREIFYHLSMPAVRDAVNTLGLFHLTLDEAISHNNPNSTTLELKDRKVEHMCRLIKNGTVNAPDVALLFDDAEFEKYPSCFNDDDRPCPLVVVPVSRHQPVLAKELKVPKTHAPEAVGMRP